MYTNGKMRPVETISGMREGGKMENSGEGEFKYDIFYTLCKNFCKFHNYTSTQHNNNKIF
jgi:hypothetical protein